MRFGRFAVYFENVEAELLKKRKLDIVLEVLESFSGGMKEIIGEQPDGVIRVIGPVKGRRAYGLVLASPFPPVFEMALRAFMASKGKSFFGVIPKWIVGLEIADPRNMTEPGRYRVTFLQPVVNFMGFSEEIKTAAEKARDFLGLKVGKLSYRIPDALFLKRNGITGRFTVEAYNGYTSFIINYFRYTGVGEMLTLGHGDVRVEKI